MLSAQAALDNAMNVEEQDLVASHENLAQAKEQLVGIVAQVKNTIEARIRKRDRSQTRVTELDTAEPQEVEIIEPMDKKPRDSN